MSQDVACFSGLQSGVAAPGQRDRPLRGALLKICVDC